jgi:hypothetical protein
MTIQGSHRRPPSAPEPPSTEAGGSRMRGKTIGTLIALAGLAVAVIAYLYPRQPVTPGPPDGRPAYIAQSDLLCRNAMLDFQRIGKMPHGDNDAVVQWAADTNAVFDNLFGKWTTLRYPTEDDAKMRAVFDAFKAVNAHLHTAKNSLDAAQESFRQNDDQAFTERLALASDEQQRAAEQALIMDNAIEAYGFKNCSGLMDFN